MKISDPVKRIDSPDKLKGVTPYIEDITFPDLLYAKTLRSDHVHAEILSIHYPEKPKGISVIDASHVPAHNQVAMIKTDMPIFATTRVNYLGEPLALVIGQDKDRVLAYMKDIKVTYKPLPPVTSMDGDDQTHQETFTDHTFKRGNTMSVDFDDKITETFTTPYQEQLYMEKQGVVGTYEEGIVTVHGSIQCPYYVLNALKHAMGMDESQLRVVQTATGGAFGGKEEFPSLIACQVAVAAYELKRPVRLVYDRREDMAFTTKRHPSKTQITSYIKDKQVVAMYFDIKLDAGPYLGLSDVVLQRAILTMTGSYNIPHVTVRGRTIKTNNVFTGAFRGFGAPQSMYALELHMSHLAKRLGQDPLAFRQKHFVKQGDLTSTGGRFHEAICLDDLVNLLKDMSGYARLKDRGNPYIGYGVSVIPHGGGFTGDGEATHIKAVVKLKKTKEGQVVILVSNVEMGQGAITTLSKIVASVLDLDINQVIYQQPDTFMVPDSGPTVASRTTMVVGALVAKAATQLKAHMDKPDEVTVSEHFKQPDYVVWNQETLTGNAYMAYSWSALLARVQVNPLTYEVNCTDIWGAYDVGLPIDDHLLLGQIHGGIVQGLGYGMMENMTSSQGKIDQVAFASYPIPTSQDVPKMHAKWIENRYEDGPFGAKAAGELTLVGVAPAVAAAIEDAMKITSHDLPLVPEVIEKELL